jgi:hypothetical protein
VERDRRDIELRLFLAEPELLAARLRIEEGYGDGGLFQVGGNEAVGADEAVQICDRR